MRPILVEPDPRLRQRAAPAVVSDRATADLVDELLAVMRAAQGLGLAATQLGVGVRVAVVEIAERTIVLVNPVLERVNGHQLGWEGCLSVPGRVAEVERPGRVRIRAVDLDGRLVRWDGSGLLARALLHELDHLDGRLYTDFVAPEALIDTRLHPTPPRS